MATDGGNARAAMHGVSTWVVRLLTWLHDVTRRVANMLRVLWLAGEDGPSVRIGLADKLVSIFRQRS